MDKQKNSQRYKSDAAYLHALYDELKYLPRHQRLKIVNAYRVKINHAMDYCNDMNKTIDQLPSPEEAVAEIYQQKGEKYIAKCRKTYKRRQIIFALISILLAILLTTFVVSLYAFLGYLSINKFHLWNALRSGSIISSGLITLLILTYWVLTIIVSIYILDIYIIVVKSMLKQSFLLWWSKGLKYLDNDFLITDWISQITDKPKFMKKAFVVTVIVLTSLFAGGFFMKTYVYYSFHQTVDTKNAITHVPESFVNTINIEGGECRIIISQGDTLAFKYSNQLGKPLEYVEKDGVMTISLTKTKTYDFFGLLKEPPQLVEIIMPSGLQPAINLEIERLNISVKTNVNSQITIVDGFITDLAATEVTINSLNIETNKITASIKECYIVSLNLECQKGKFLSNENDYQDINIKNYNAQIGFEKTNAETLTIYNDVGTIVFLESKITNVSFETNTSTAAFDDFEFDEATFKTVYASKLAFFEGKVTNFNCDINGGDLQINKFTGNLNILTKEASVSLNYLTGTVSVESSGGLVKIYDAFLSSFNASLSSINQVQIYNIGVLDIFELELTNCISALDQIYAPKVKVTAHNGQTYYSNDEYERTLLIEHSDPFYHDIYKEETKIKEIIFDGDIVSRNVYVEN